MNMQLAAELCLKNYRTPDAMADAFAAAGFTLAPGMDAGSYEVSAPEMWGIVSPGQGESYCNIQSQAVPLSTAQAIGTALGDRLFPGMASQGSPEGGHGPCDGISILAPQRMIWISYSQAGNSGECIDDGTSAIVLQM